MFRMNRRSILKASAASVAATSLPQIASAQSSGFTPPQHSPEDLRPGGILTPFGAIKAGNADGTIPAWTGENLPLPAGYVSGDPRPIPFADEKPLYVITSANISQYADKLSEGLKALFQKHPDFTVQVYPTHRTAIAPQWVYDNIYKNATRAQLIDDGNALSGAYGGIPFPIPKNGHEVMWNHELAWAGTTVYFVSDAHVITASGEVVMENRANVWFQFPYYIKDGESTWNGFYLQQFVDPTAPPYTAGASIVRLQTVNPIAHPIEAWAYLAGQRRVRQAPELQFDTPNALSGGTTNWDEANMFAGQMVEYDFNYVGIKEIIVPYNTNKANHVAIKDQFMPHFINPDITRWELHRCRIVEMQLKAGARNVDARRTIYCDEDTGGAIMADVYDASGELWKFMHNMPLIFSDVPCLNTEQWFCVYNLHSGVYSAGDHYDSETHPIYKVIPQLPDTFFTPAELSNKAGGF